MQEAGAHAAQPLAEPHQELADARRGVEGRFMDLEKLHELKFKVKDEYGLVRKKSSEQVQATMDEEPAVVGYIWSCLPLLECWRQLLGQQTSRGLVRANEIRARTVGSRGLALQQRWGADEAAVEISVVALSGAETKLRVARRATVAEIKARLAAMNGTPQPEIALICGNRPMRDEESLPAETLAGPGPHAFVLRVQRRRVLSASHDGALKLWDSATGDCLGTLRGHGDAILSMTVDWKTRRALTGSHDCRLKLWDLDHCMCVGTFLSLGHPAFCLVADWPGMYALSGSWDRLIKVWSLETGEELGVLAGHEGPITCLRLDWGLKKALSAAQDGVMKLWDLSDLSRMRECWSVDGHNGVKITALAADWQAHRGVSGDEDGILKVWNMQDGTCVRTIAGHTLAISAVALDPAVAFGARGIFSTSWDRTLRQWSVGGEEPATAARAITVYRLEVAVTCMDIDFGVSCALCGVGKALQIWDVEAGKELMVLKGHEDTISCVNVEPTDRH